MPATKTTTQPYPPGTEWTFTSRRNPSFTQTTQLVLYPEPDGSAMSDDYLPDEADAATLWRKWVNQYAVTYHQRYPDKYRLGEVPILWAVTKPSFGGVFEAAPHAPNVLSEDFLTHYTHPTHAKNGEPINWARLLVMDKAWNDTGADKGGFIQEATGWKPAPLQSRMDFVTVGRAAGLYVPDLR
ncbi:hypothetical protein AB0896_16370 [Streptomyces parvulus]|uniref:hypothetical protein n=1 Tax=Streptomyces parvulus TaxID=146923 RepID=UPI0034518B2E